MTKKILQAVLQKAKSDFNIIQEALKDEREQCLTDRRFYSIPGAQWEGRLGDQYENKPRFEVNKVHMSVMRIINEYRNNRIAVNFVSKTGEDDKLSSTLDDMLRADEDSCGAQEAYDNAFEEAVGGGFGAWRLSTCYEDYEDDGNEHIKVTIEPINDADSSVFFDLGAKRQDKSDATQCFVITAIPRQQYIDEYDDNPSDWPKTIDKTEFDWATPDVVYIAEYYQCEKVKEKVIYYEGIDGQEESHRESKLKEDQSIVETLLSTGYREVRYKEIEVKKVKKYILDGAKIIEDCGFIDGNNIPIIPVYGKRWFVDNIERCMGHVRLAKDAQRLKNMQLSKLGELAALSSVEKPILTPEQIAGHEIQWADDNIKNFPYLLINPLVDMNGNMQPAGPLSYTKPPAIPPAMGALLQVTEQDMQELLGNQQAAEEMQPNISGKAVELIQNKLDMQTYIYMSNMAKAMKRSGEVWLSMAKDVYTEESRNMKTLSKNSKVGSVELKRPVLNKETGELEYENDIENASYDVSVDVGPSTSTKRASTVRELTGMMQMTADPETQNVLSSMALMNMEGEGLEDIRDYFRNKLLRMGAIKPTEEEAQQLQAEAQNRQPSPQDQYMQAEAMNAAAKAEKAKADTIKVRAETIETIADTEKTKAETVATLSSVDQSERDATVATLEKLQEIQNQKASATPKVSEIGVTNDI